ncbi:hypothetical protein IFM89_005612 [Coptis chinensis]|uniref:Uncharacterized protein n=1 Tax=Coptis chinensis TaxID=261450 RepID=A0A835LYN1_9MAGN|nr:hypothetical protein IFM89_005612 [Coptis chinensis]
MLLCSSPSLQDKVQLLFNNVIGKVLYLTVRREKYLVVAAVRFVCTIISRHYRENCKVRGSVNAVDPRKRIDECALEKEEKDYFNEDSDEEDSTSAQSSHIRKQEAQPISNRIRFSLRPIPGRLVDYDDDDDEEEKELGKKQRLDKTLSNNVHATSPSTCSFSSFMKGDFVLKHNITKFSDRDNNSNEKTIEKKVQIQEAVLIACPIFADTRQASEEVSPLLVPNGGNKSSLEMAANGAIVAGSEPYSVR